MQLYFLYLGTMQPGNIPVPGYLIRTADKVNILVDTGWPRSFVESPQHPSGLTIEIRPEDTVTARLADIGLTPSDIHYLVCTHLDDDHCGNHDLFPHAELIIQQQHYALAKEGHPRFAANRDAWAAEMAQQSQIPQALFLEELQPQDLNFTTSPRIDPFLTDSFTNSVEQAHSGRLIRSAFSAKEWVDGSFVEQALKAQKLENHWPQYSPEGQPL